MIRVICGALLLLSGCARLTGSDRVPDETRTAEYPPLRLPASTGVLPRPQAPKPVAGRDQVADAGLRAAGLSIPAPVRTPGDAVLLHTLGADTAVPVSEVPEVRQRSLLERWLNVDAVTEPVLKP